MVLSKTTSSDDTIVFDNETREFMTLDETVSKLNELVQMVQKPEKKSKKKSSKLKEEMIDELSEPDGGWWGDF